MAEISNINSSPEEGMNKQGTCIFPNHDFVAVCVAPYCQGTPKEILNKIRSEVLDKDLFIP